MPANSPSVKYNSIKLNGTNISLSGSCKASFVSPYNKITVSMTPSTSLSYYEVRVTKSNEAYDIGVGQLAYYATNVAGNTAKTFDINVNSTNFTGGSGTYRISLYAQNAADYSWDVTYLFMVIPSSGSTNQLFAPKGSDGLEVSVIKQNV
jgi:hypothetical protein